MLLENIVYHGTRCDMVTDVYTNDNNTPLASLAAKSISISMTRENEVTGIEDFHEASDKETSAKPGIHLYIDTVLLSLNREKYFLFNSFNHCKVELL